MSKAATKKAPRKKAANGYKLPEPIPKGEILTDLKKQRWIIGSSIGVGGFGEIYAAASYKDKIPTDYPAVIKIEPHGNGPLFVEMHFYMRNANPTDINNWKKDKVLPNLGMPPFLGSGSHECNGQKYRFVVMERYGIDLWKLFLANGRQFPEPTVYKVAWQIINVLEYIHNKTYVHADIKGANLLLDLKSQNHVYLVDFGLASHYTTKDYKLDPKKAHNGTIEYTSRDAHMGVPTMRGDLEILLYNILQWLCGTLPWEKSLNDPSWVQQQKENAFKNVKQFLKDCFKTSDVPTVVIEFMTLLSTMTYNDTPNYDKFRDILVKGLNKLNHAPTGGKLEFTVKKAEKTSFTPRKIAKAAAQSTGSAKKTKSTAAAAPAKSPKGRRIVVPDNDSLNDSIDSVILDEKCMSGKDMRRKLLENIDGDAEYDVQIKKRKTKASASNGNTPIKPPAKRGRKKIEITLDSSITDSEPEVVSKGTKSRPGTKATPTKSKPMARVVKRLSENDSEKDMFDDSND
ncbi:serine/threonine-protein kinase VRK1-like [Phymastichus coffea]|uniref:serine/threonine-protein kinase VRK1-like n=1 Tax=Phymastichus coffea TaxID=108790 RepID=UPI00273BE9D4|nr:serine/threonine-protein kinase VRK1-like [Phymastichus coffea]